MLVKDSVGVVGLGYVGLPLALGFCNKGFQVWGVDSAPDKISLLRQGRSYVSDVADAAIKHCLETGRFSPAVDYDGLSQVEVICICVPTPLRKTRDPDMSYVVAVAEELVKVLRKGQLIILESTVYPGATEELVSPILEKSGLRAGVDFSLAFSPERVDPGNKRFTPLDVPKVVGGLTPRCTERAAAIYRRVFNRVVPVASSREAEMTKLLENTFRAVNIGLINELALVARKMGINIWNVIAAAETKPFGFMPFYPGPGLGGHCIPIDPFYLAWKAKAYDADTSFIELADRVNRQMPNHVVGRVAELLNNVGKPLRNAKILLLGVAYKPDVNDIRESPALDIVGHLVRSGSHVSYNDPLVGEFDFMDQTWQSQLLSEELLESQDCVVIVTDHTSYDWDFVAAHARLLLDCRNATRRARETRENVHLL